MFKDYILKTTISDTAIKGAGAKPFYYQVIKHIPIEITKKSDEFKHKEK